MGRPTSEINEYIDDSKQKIAAWLEEINLQTSENEKTKIKNKISAQRSRMNSKMKQDTSMKRIAGYQSNFSKLSKILAEVNCPNAKMLHSKIIAKINGEKALENIPITRNVFINELEKFVWVVKDNSDKQ